MGDGEVDEAEVVGERAALPKRVMEDAGDRRRVIADDATTPCAKHERVATLSPG